MASFVSSSSKKQYYGFTVNLDIKNRKPAYLGDDEIEGVVYFDWKEEGSTYTNGDSWLKDGKIYLDFHGKFPFLYFYSL